MTYVSCYYHAFSGKQKVRKKKTKSGDDNRTPAGWKRQKCLSFDFMSSECRKLMSALTRLPFCVIDVACVRRSEQLSISGGDFRARGTPIGSF